MRLRGGNRKLGCPASVYRGWGRAENHGAWEAASPSAVVSPEGADARLHTLLSIPSYVPLPPRDKNGSRRSQQPHPAPVPLLTVGQCLPAAHQSVSDARYARWLALWLQLEVPFGNL